MRLTLIPCLRILDPSFPTGISRGSPGVATPGVSSFWGSIVNRTVFLVDGFNLYHSLREVERGRRHSLRWLDPDALRSSLLHAVPGRCEVAGIVYFSALARRLPAERPAVPVHRRLRPLAVLYGWEPLLRRDCVGSTVVAWGAPMFGVYVSHLAVVRCRDRGCLPRARYESPFYCGHVRADRCRRLTFAAAS